VAVYGLDRREGGKVGHRFIVSGNWCEYIATLHCVATSPEEAMEKWINSFSEEERAGLFVRVIDCDEKTFMLKHWEHDGYRFFSGGYIYNHFTG